MVVSGSEHFDPEKSAESLMEPTHLQISSAMDVLAPPTRSAEDLLAPPPPATEMEANADEQVNGFVPSDDLPPLVQQTSRTQTLSIPSEHDATEETSRNDPFANDITPIHTTSAFDLLAPPEE